MREKWGGRAGFILAGIGSAVGLGNIRRFAQVAGENGGGAFLLVLLAIVGALGVPLVVAELAIGKRGGADAATAFKALAPRSAWRHAGWIGVVGAALILFHYAVIAGWALRHFALAMTGTLWEVPAGGYAESFGAFVAAPVAPALWQAAMMSAVMPVVAGGVAATLAADNSRIAGSGRCGATAGSVARKPSMRRRSATSGPFPNQVPGRRMLASAGVETAVAMPIAMPPRAMP
jgi:SNF family Na+-dependent transporter